MLGRYGRKGTRNTQLVKPGSRFVSNPWGWQLYMWGGGERKRDARTGKTIALPVQAGEVVAFRAQGSGASMWAICAPQVEERYPIFCGTYDSFTILVPNATNEVHKAAEYLKGVMEQPWAEVDGMVFPVEVSWGLNLGKYSEDNPYGLKELHEA